MATNNFLVVTAFKVEPQMRQAYDEMLSIVDEYMDDSNFFSIGFKSTFSAYDVRLEETVKMNEKPKWKQFFSETYAGVA